MNILEEIQNCPVEWKELGVVCSVNKGKQLNKNLLIDDGLYPAYMEDKLIQEELMITMSKLIQLL